MCRHVNSLVVLGPQIHLNINFCFSLKKYLFRQKNYKVGHIYPNKYLLTYLKFFHRLIVNWVGFFCYLNFFCETACSLYQSII